MEKQFNPVQEYIDELNKNKIPDNEVNILDFLSSLNSDLQKGYLSFILSQSHIVDNMEVILDTYTHTDFYCNAGYNEKEGNIVPKLGKDDSVYYEEYTSSDATDRACKKILKSLQSDDKTAWNKFVKYVKSMYESSKMDIYRDVQLNQFANDVLDDFNSLGSEIIQNDYLRTEIDELKNKPVVQEKGVIKKIRSFFAERKKEKEIQKKESQLQDDSQFSEKALALIEKNKGNKNASRLMKNQIEFAERLIKAGLPKETFMKVLNGIGNSVESSAYSNNRTFDMLKQLSVNAEIAQKLYTPEILYAKSFQDMTKNIRVLIARSDLTEQAPITTEYRTKPLRNRMQATEDISNVLKGNNLSQEEIQAKMAEFDEEYEGFLKEENPERYVRNCTDLMMKFVSTHPFDDGNGRTSRMLLQTMLARRGIVLPSNIDNYFERQSDTEYSKMEESCLKTEDYTKMEDYIVERVKQFNNGELILNDEPLTFEDKQRQNVEELARN